MKQVLTVFSDLIADYDVLIDIDEGAFYHFYVRVRFRDGTMLYAREYVNLKQARKYAYHWQQADDTLLIRWDNSPHHTNIPTYPHHQHVGTEENVQPSMAMDSRHSFKFYSGSTARNADTIISLLSNSGRLGNS